jgi:hypothetical protein
MSETLTVDDLTFQVRRSPRRKTVEITVDRGGELSIAAPPDVDRARMVDFVREKQFWLYAKLAEKASRDQPMAGKEFVSGEGFPHIGRSYRLLLVDEQDVPLKLEAGRFKLRRSLAPQGREHFVLWYTQHANSWLRRRVKDWASRMGVTPHAAEARELGFRWGSCGQGGNVNFHWAVITLPASVVDYVIVHELAHLVEPNHSPEFWNRVARALPDYERRKTWLAEYGGGHIVL